MHTTAKPRHLPNEEYQGEKCYCLTMCCENRAAVFRDAGLAVWIIEFLRSESAVHNFVVDAYCVMPDHLHVLMQGVSPTSDLVTFAKNFKQKTAYAYLQKAHSRLWQKNYYDHILRSKEETNRVAAYIWLNPVRRGLCDYLEEYPFSGSFVRAWKNPSNATAWTPPWKNSRAPT